MLNCALVCCAVLSTCTCSACSLPGYYRDSAVAWPALALPSAEYCLITTFAVRIPLSMAPLSVAVPVWSPQQYMPSATCKVECVGG